MQQSPKFTKIAQTAQHIHFPSSKASGEGFGAVSAALGKKYVNMPSLLGDYPTGLQCWGCYFRVYTAGRYDLGFANTQLFLRM